MRQDPSSTGAARLSEPSSLPNLATPSTDVPWPVAQGPGDGPAELPRARSHWLTVLLAPWSTGLRPRRSGEVMALASWRAALAMIGVNTLLLAGVAIGVALFEGTVRYVYDDDYHAQVRAVQRQAQAATTAPSGAPVHVEWPEPRLEQRSVAEVWREWHRDQWFGPPVAILFVTLVAVAAALAFLGWLHLPVLHREGSIGPAFWRGTRVAALLLGPAVVVTAIVGFGTVMMDHLAILGGAGFFDFRRLLGVDLPFWFGVAVPLGIAAVVAWLAAAVRGARIGEHEPALPPVCEGCGYDLTHVPESGRCSECGFAIEDSLVYGRRRSQITWELERTLPALVLSAKKAALAPCAFYEGQAVRLPDDSVARFARLNYIMLTLIAFSFAWFMVLILKIRYGPGPPLNEVLFVVTSFSLISTLVLWAAHRVIAALIFSATVYFGALPDFRRFTRVLAFETVYLWGFCTFWAVCALSFALFKDWLSSLTGYNSGRFARGLRFPPEFYLVAGGTLVIFVLWMRRYRIALRALRWANF